MRPHQSLLAEEAVEQRFDHSGFVGFYRHKDDPESFWERMNRIHGTLDT